MNTKDSPLNDTLLELLFNSPSLADSAEWNAILNKIGEDLEDRYFLNSEAYCSSTAQLAAWLAFYFSMRGAMGTGDHGHNEAVKYAQKEIIKVRKALGYSYP